MRRTQRSLPVSAFAAVLASFAWILGSATRLDAADLVSPEGGVVVSGTAQTVSWTMDPGESRFTLKYSVDDGRHWVTAKTPDGHAAVKVAATSVDWQVPRLTRDKSRCRLKLIAYGPTGKRVGADRSDAPFAVKTVKVTSPAGGEALTSGGIHPVTWQVGSTSKPVAATVLTCTRDGGATWSLIAVLPGDPGRFEWTLPEVQQTDARCRVRVLVRSSGGKVLGEDVSDGEFSIAPALISPVTDPATEVTDSSAHVTGRFVNADGYTSTAWFEYGPGASYGSSTAPRSYAAVGPITLSAQLTGLAERTSHSVRLVVENTEGTFLGNVRTFRTYATPVVLASGLNAPIDLRLSGTDLYWLEIYGEAVKRVPASGGQVSVVATSNMGGNDGNLALDGTYVYWADYNTIWKKPRDGGQVTTVITGLQSIRRLALYSGALYVRTDAGIDRIVVSSGVKTRLLTFSDPLAFQFGLLVDSTGIYLGDWTSIARLGLDGGAVTTLAVDLYQPSGLLLDAGYLYWGNGGSILRVRTTGGAVSTVASGASAWSFASDGARLYWTGSTAGSWYVVASAPLGGGEVVTHAAMQLTYTSGIGSLVVDETSLYWITGGSSYYPPLGSVRSIPKSVP